MCPAPGDLDTRECRDGLLMAVQKGASLKRLIMLSLVLTLTAGIAKAGETLVPECSCELCAQDLDQTCRSSWTGLLHPCVTYYGTYCQAG